MAKEQVPQLFSGEVATYLWVAGATFWGAVVSYFDKAQHFNWRKLFAHFSSSAFAGLMTFLLCKASQIDGPLMGVLCGIAAYMGTPAIIKLLMRHKAIKAFFDTEEEKKSNAEENREIEGR
jgi:ABC-type Fe3+-siderophore transport system permease subunit